MKKFKYVPKVKTISGKFFESSSKHLQRFISDNKCGYEVIDGKCIPYYDYDNKFNSEIEQKNAWETEILNTYKKIQDKFPNGNVLSFDASGFNTTKDQWVNSFHFLVRGVGYYESGKDMFEEVGIEGFDTTVYKDAGKRQLFRMPYCSKEGDAGTRPLKRVFITKDGITTVAKLEDISNECEKIEEYLVQNINNEIQIQGKPIQKQKPAIKTKEEKQAEITKLIYPTMIPSTNDEISKKQYNMEDIRALVYCLNPTRQKWEWVFWKDVMWCLRNIADKLNLPQLKELAHSISKENDNYDAVNTNAIYDAKDKWDGEAEIGIGSLIRWAKEINPEQFNIWKNTIKQQQAVKNFSGSSKKDYDIELLLSLFSDDDIAEYFVLTQGINYHIGIDKEIYHWEKNYWIKTDESVISIVLSETIYNAMKTKLDIHYNKTNNEKEYILLFKKISSLRNCKPRLGYVKSIIEKLKRKQFIKGENIEFDLKPYLLCFKNGVFDLTNDTFREGKREDFISQIIPYDWHTSAEDETTKLMDFISMIMPHEDERDCLLRSLSSTLCGKLLEYFLILTGTGRNGKDTLITGLLQSTLGQDHYYNSSVALLTNQNRSGISQEKANMNKKRAVIYAEPGKNEVLRCDTLKELRGCPQLNARGIYSKNTIVHNISTHIMHCNATPQLDEVDDAIANSLVIFPFRALFRTEEKMKEYPEGTKYLYKVDSYYKSPEFLENNKLVFMNILLTYYKQFRADGHNILNIPKTMKERTEGYLQDSDDFMGWFEEKFEQTKSEDDFIKIGKDVYIQYRQSDLYANLNKKEKRKANLKHLVKDIEDNPNLRPYYRARFRPYINGKQHDHTHVLIMHKIKLTDDVEDSMREFVPHDSDDED